MALHPGKDTPEQRNRLYDLALRKGYRVEHALTPGYWNLFDASEQFARTGTGAVNFRIDVATSFLAKLPDVAPPLVPDL